MKFSAVTLFATGAVAGLVGRQASVFQDALESVTQAVQALDDGINSFQGAADAVTLQQASEAAIQAITDATNNVNGADPITINEAVPLTTPLQNLSDLVVQTVDDAVAKKSAFEDAGVAGVVYDQLVQQQQAANAFSEASLGKLDDAAAQIAQGLIDPINSALQSGVDAFSSDAAQTSTDGGSEPTSTDAGTEPTTTDAGTEPTTTEEPTETEVPATYTPTEPETTETPAPYDPNGAASNAVSFGAIAVAAVAAIAAL